MDFLKLEDLKPDYHQGHKFYYLEDLKKAPDYKVLKDKDFSPCHPDKVFAFGKTFNCYTHWVERGYNCYYIRCYLKD